MDCHLFRTAVLSFCVMLAACTPAANTDLLPIPCPTDVFCVDDDAPSGGDGRTWDRAFQTVQEAVDAAVSGQQVWVAEGTYRPAAANASVLTMKAGVSVYGGFAGTETLFTERPDPPRMSVLTGDYNGDDPADINDPVGIDDNSAHVVVLDTDVKLDGFTVTAGVTPLITNGHLGSAIYAYPNSVVFNASLSKLDIVRNYAVAGVAFDYAIYIVIAANTGLMDLDSVLFMDNQGGIFSAGPDVAIRRSLVWRNGGLPNWAWGAPGIMYLGGETITIEDSSFVDNSSFTKGAIDCVNCPALSIVRSQFVGNHGTGGGAIGMYVSEKLTVMDSSFIQNKGEAGALYLPAIRGDLAVINSTFSSNETLTGLDAGNGAGAILLGINDGSDTWSVNLLNNVFANNIGLLGVGAVVRWSDSGIIAINVNIQNSVFWNNTGVTAPDIYDANDITPSVTTGFSCSNNSLSGTGNVLLGSNPFVEAASGELYLDPASPCADAGSNAAADDATTGFPSVGLDWRNLTTRLDAAADTGTVDMGRHYDPAAVVVLTFGVDATTATWTTRNATGCSLVNDQDSTVYSVPAGDLDSGTTAHGLTSGAEFTLICTGVPYPARATAPVH